MPKLNNRFPKYCKQSKSSKYAVVYYRGKTIHLGIYGSKESKTAYSRFLAEIQANPTGVLPIGEKNVTVCELTAAFLEHAKLTLNSTNYSFYRIIVLDFLDKLYGDDIPVESFKPRCLKRVRDEMIRSGRFCRKIVNRYVFRMVFIFRWGVENDLVQETTWRALKSVSSLPEGHPGTFENKEREPVPDDVIRRTLPFMPPTLRAMVQLQRILGMRPNEIFKMRVGDIDRSRKNGLWYYVPGSYKTSRFVGKIVFPLGQPEQELIAPYLEGKTSEQAVFSPRTAMQERNAEKRANEKRKYRLHRRLATRQDQKNLRDILNSTTEIHIEWLLNMLLRREIINSKTKRKSRIGIRIRCGTAPVPQPNLNTATRMLRPCWGTRR